ncbi:hypothetical protein D1227_06335 [Henriciella mobilis]|nr:hypothetical protein D1231_09265 [Henriciella mobilis]RIJ21181.1 hypothetical protein D1227_12805 [Henriciella mobilis]RIJ23118.1 hypothetical protein D1227_06335 [Henriciella mobilis]
MTDTYCSYCGRPNGGHTLACSALARDAADGDSYLRKVRWEREQLPFSEREKPPAPKTKGDAN